MLAVLLAALESDEDKQKFTEIYELYHVQMEQTAIRILKDQHDAEDAVQNAFMQIIRHFEKIYEIPCEKLPFWIICIVKNEATTILRKNKRIVQLILKYQDAGRALFRCSPAVSSFPKQPDMFPAVWKIAVPVPDNQ